MATITLKDIPTPIHRALKQRAKQHGRSLNKEALACLEAAVRPSKIDTASVLAEIRDHRSNLPGKLKDTLIQKARRSGRP